MKQSLEGVKSVLILGTENIIVLPVTRSLGQLLPQAKINTLSPLKNGRPAWSSSRYINDCHYFYSNTHSNKLLELIECIKISGADIVLPAGETYVRFMAEHFDAIKKHAFIPPLPKTELFDRLVNKITLNELLKKYGFPHPKNYKLNDPELQNRDIKTHPLLLKSARGSSGSGMRKVDEKSELEGIIKNVNPEDFFLQEEIEGEIIGCSFLAINGELKAFLIQKNLAKSGYNFSTAMEYIHHDEIYNTTFNLAEITGYSGLANLDFILDRDSGKAILIDFNARFWVSLMGAKAAGIDFTKLYCLAALGQQIENQIYEECIYLMGKSALTYHKDRMFNPFTPKPSKSIYTDLSERFGDLEPEIKRFMTTRFKK